MPRQHPKKQHASKPSITLFLVCILGLLAVFIAGVFLASEEGICKQELALFAEFPPSLKVGPNEKALWVKPLSTDPNIAVSDLINRMKASSLSIPRAAASYLNEGTYEIHIVEGLAPGGSAMATGLNPQTKKVQLTVGTRILRDGDQVKAALALIHEAVHLWELEEYLRAHGFEATVAYAKERGNMQCSEMQAYAIEMAAYRQYAALGYLLEGFSDSATRKLMELNWGWNSKEWLDFLGEKANPF
jgi:hypothetical protein